MMKEKNDKTLYFYSSKIKNILFTVIGMLLVILGITVCIVGYLYNDYTVIIIGAVLTIFCSWITVYLIKRLFITEPYLTLTDQQLIINSPLIYEIPIKRGDIGSYETKYQNFNTTIELILPDEKKYKAQLSGIKRKLNSIATMGGVYNTFIIGLNQVKKKDRGLLYYVLDNMNKPGFDFKEYDRKEQLRETNRTKDSLKLEDKITKDYFLSTYSISLLIAGFSWYILAMKDITLIIVSFLLFPFAKVLYDAIIGFKIDEKMKKQDSVFIYFYRLIYTIYLLLFIFSFVIAPFGVLFLLVRAVYRFLKLK